jgi:hypothetical protein
MSILASTTEKRHTFPAINTVVKILCARHVNQEQIFM